MAMKSRRDKNSLAVADTESSEFLHNEEHLFSSGNEQIVVKSLIGS